MVRAVRRTGLKSGTAVTYRRLPLALDRAPNSITATATASADRALAGLIALSALLHWLAGRRLGALDPAGRGALRRARARVWHGGIALQRGVGLQRPLSARRGMRLDRGPRDRMRRSTVPAAHRLPRRVPVFLWARASCGPVRAPGRGSALASPLLSTRGS